MSHKGLDGGVTEGWHVVGLPIVVEAMRNTAVKESLMRSVSDGADEVHQGRTEGSKRSEYPLTFFHARAGIAGGEYDDGTAVDVLGQPWVWRGLPQGNKHRELIRDLRDVVAVKPEDLQGPLGGVHQHSSQDLRPDGMEMVLERRDDAEVPAATADTPEQVGMLLVADHQKLSVGGDHVGGEQ